MKIYLKSGQTVDLGDVKEIKLEGEKSIVPFKYAKDGDEVYGLDEYGKIFEYDRMVQFYTNNQIFECHQSDVIAVLEDRK